MKQNRGFSLLELMLVVVLIGIISMVLYPSYTEHLLKVRRLAAITVLSMAAGQMEDHYVQFKTYRDAVLTSRVLYNPQIEQYYQLSIVSADDSSYVLQAIPIGTQAMDECGTLILDHLGRQSVRAELTDNTKCWL